MHHITGERNRGTDEVDATEEDRTEAAQRYVLDRCTTQRFIDRQVVGQLTGWDPPHISRFVSAVQDALQVSQGRRPRGRPRKNF